MRFKNWALIISSEFWVSKKEGGFKKFVKILVTPGGRTSSEVGRSFDVNPSRECAVVKEFCCGDNFFLPLGGGLISFSPLSPGSIRGKGVINYGGG